MSNIILILLFLYYLLIHIGAAVAVGYDGLRSASSFLLTLKSWEQVVIESELHQISRRLIDINANTVLHDSNLENIRLQCNNIRYHNCITTQYSPNDDCSIQTKKNIKYASLLAQSELIDVNRRKRNIDEVEETIFSSKSNPKKMNKIERYMNVCEYFENNAHHKASSVADSDTELLDLEFKCNYLPMIHHFIDRLSTRGIGSVGTKGVEYSKGDLNISPNQSWQYFDDTAWDCFGIIVEEIVKEIICKRFSTEDRNENNAKSKDNLGNSNVSSYDSFPANSENDRDLRMDTVIDNDMGSHLNLEVPMGLIPSTCNDALLIWHLEAVVMYILQAIDMRDVVASNSELNDMEVSTTHCDQCKQSHATMSKRSKATSLRMCNILYKYICDCLYILVGTKNTSSFLSELWDVLHERPQLTNSLSIKCINFKKFIYSKIHISIELHISQEQTSNVEMIKWYCSEDRKKYNYVDIDAKKDILIDLNRNQDYLDYVEYLRRISHNETKPQSAVDTEVSQQTPSKTVDLPHTELPELYQWDKNNSFAYIKPDFNAYV